uniref:alpha-mannosidase n=1 Tax=Macrostomum lignano TaxID=282301 RepID=A0A1I8IN08_9PLAT
WHPMKMQTALLPSLLLLLLTAAEVPGGAATSASCGYNGCPAAVPRRVNLHIVPHTHDDVGWLRTVDQYYYYSVQFILDNVIRELSLDSKRKFTYVEMAFFYRWWREQSNSTRDQVRQLVANGQLHFAQGGWCMNDEATTHYADIVDQQTLGMRFLNDTFGDCARPRVGWQIDPFGHSKEFAALLAQMGLDAFYFARIHFLDEVQRVITRRMQFVWHASRDFGSPSADIFAGDFVSGYCYPPGTNYEGGDQPVQDDPQLHDFNVAEAVRKFIVQVDLLRLAHRTSHLLLTMGCDFAYENARKNFKIIDKLIAAVNANTSQHNLTAYYSSPDCYTKAVNDEGLAYAVKTGDFFPYASGPNSYWTGFYSSRPALKRLVRWASGHLQAVKQLAAVGPAVLGDASERLDRLRQAQGWRSITMQWLIGHKRVSNAVLYRRAGLVRPSDLLHRTEKQAVAFDYALRLSDGIASSDPLWQARLAQLQFGNLSQRDGLRACQLLNASYCPVSELATGRFFVTFYNPASRLSWHSARLPVTGRYYRVLDEAGAPVTSQTIPVNNGTLRVPERNLSIAVNELAFFVASIPPLGYAVYSVEPCNSTDPGASVFTPILPTTNAGRSASEISVGLAFYIGMRGNSSGEQFRPSGAYVFRPTTDRPQTLSARIQAQVIGPVVNETHFNYNDWAYLVTRQYPGASSNYLEAESTVGPLPLDDGVGREVVAVYSADGLSASSGEFLVDSNGRQLMRARRDPSRPEAAQFRPANAIVSVADAARQLTVLTDRAAAASSRPAEGQLSVMLHRVTLDDDGFGVGEALRERGSDGRGLVVKTSHWYFLAEPAAAADRYRLLASQRHRSPLVTFSLLQPRSAWCQWSALTAPLPDSVQILTLEPWRQSPDRLLLRLENIFQANESSAHSGPVTVDLGATFSAFAILDAVELNLSANQRLADQTRLKWRSMQTEAVDQQPRRGPLTKSLEMTLRPMEIRTFEIRVAYKGGTL